MSTNRLIRSLPFWVLVGGSVVAIAGGAFLLISKLNTMATTLTDGTATGVEVYAGQIWAVSGAILAGAGFVGLALALTLGALRSVGIPARYVSGYLHPRPDAVVGETVVGESHAWVEWFCGAWKAYDPTNLIDIGDRHVTVGRGRDYGDVAPLRGVYAGPYGSKLFVTVEITREA